MLNPCCSDGEENFSEGVHQGFFTPGNRLQCLDELIWEPGGVKGEDGISWDLRLLCG